MGNYVAKNRIITQEKFDALLAWLDSDRTKAGTKYEDIRQSLVRIFAWRGFADPEGLADETIDRVTDRVDELKTSFVGDPARYFYSVAKRLALEEQRRAKSHTLLEESSAVVSPEPTEESADSSELASECLKRCIQRLSPENREMVMSYYLKEKRAKIDHRRRLAERLGIEINALRVRMYRLRSGLELCIKRCLEESALSEMD
jgi:RNA polymerase sigma factor (sigma-70 family)